MDNTFFTDNRTYRNWNPFQWTFQQLNPRDTERCEGGASGKRKPASISRFGKSQGKNPRHQKHVLETCGKTISILTSNHVPGRSENNPKMPPESFFIPTFSLPI